MCGTLSEAQYSSNIKEIILLKDQRKVSLSSENCFKGRKQKVGLTSHFAIKKNQTWGPRSKYWDKCIWCFYSYSGRGHLNNLFVNGSSGSQCNTGGKKWKSPQTDWMTKVVAGGLQCTGRTAHLGKNSLQVCLCDAELETGTCKSGRRLESLYW